MRLSPPTNIAFWISVVLGALGLLGELGVITAVAGFAFWFVMAGLILMIVATMVKGL